MAINQLIAQGGTMAQPVSAMIQGQQAAQTAKANQLAINAKQLENSQALAQDIRKAAEWADTPEKWNQAVDFYTSQGIQGAAQYRDRFDQREKLLKMYPGAPKKYTYKVGGAGGDKKQLFALSGTEATPIGKPFGVGGGTTINVGGKGEGEFWKQLSKGQADAVNKGYEQAQNSAQSLAVNQKAREILNSGIITGKGAKLMTGAGRILTQIGIPIGKNNEETLKNTQTYAGMMARQVGTILSSGAFGAGTGISDADREYVEKIAAGNIELDEVALRNLLDINDRIELAKIDKYNKKAEQLQKSENYKLPYSITVEIPNIADLPSVMELRNIRTSAAKEGYTNLGEWEKDKGFAVYDQSGKKVGYYGLAK